MAAKPADIVAAGLSPRVRGKQILWAYQQANPRSIPACAGEAAHSEPAAVLP